MSKIIFFLGDRGRILFLTRIKNNKKIFFALYIPQHNTESIAKSYSMFVGRSRLSKSLGGKTDIALFQNELFVLVPITADLQPVYTLRPLKFESGIGWKDFFYDGHLLVNNQLVHYETLDLSLLSKDNSISAKISNIEEPRQLGSLTRWQNESKIRSV